MKFDFPRGGEYLFRVKAFGEQAGPDPVKVAFKADGKVIHKADVTATRTTRRSTRRRSGRGAAPSAWRSPSSTTTTSPTTPTPTVATGTSSSSRSRSRGRSSRGPCPSRTGRSSSAGRSPARATPRSRREVLGRFASRAFRRPARPDEVARLVQLVEMAERDGEPFARGVQLAVEAVLVSPHFLFRVEMDRRQGLSTDLQDDEIASRLSYFLWSSMPDEELTKLARSGRPADPATLEAQARRMLKDPKAHALVENFAGQWLQTRNLDRISPDPKLFPAFDDSLAAGHEAGNGTVLRGDRAGGSRHHRLPGRRLHVRQRAAGEALRPRRRQGRRLPPRLPGRRRSRGHPDAGRAS